jgi:hypothetical protein
MVKKISVLIFSMAFVFCLSNIPKANADNLNVAGDVDEWLSFSISTTSAILAPDMVDASGQSRVASSTEINFNLGTNNPTGWIISFYSSNGALTKGSSQIPSVVGTSTIIRGSDAYGLNSTNSISGVNIAFGYNTWNTLFVAEISTTTQTILSKDTGNIESEVGKIKIYATANTAKEAGTYTDTLYITATPQI